MISKNLTIAAALVLISGLGFGPAAAQNTAPPAPAMAAPSGTPATGAAPAGGPAGAASLSRD